MLSRRMEMMSIFCDGELQGDLKVRAFAYPVIGETPADEVSQEGGAQDNDREELARKEGEREGERRARREFEQALKGERAQVAATIHQFRAECDRYFRQVEAEVVQLALSIARKVLHREAQVDPLLLTGIVRVAVQKLETGTRVKVMVNPADRPDWKRILGEVEGRGIACELHEDVAVARGKCVLQTQMGSTELGIETQLKEIENGLFDLLAKRPRCNIEL